MAAEFFEEASLDIVHDILGRLPAKFLLRLRCVCKAWKNIIDDQLFAKSHARKQQSSSSSSTILIRNKVGGALFCLSLHSLTYGEELRVIPLNPIILRGFPRLSYLPTLSCNGLILIPHQNIKMSWAIWNPFLQHFHLLPPPPRTDLEKSNKYGRSVLERCGFGSDEGSDDYKVVRVDRFYCKKVNDDCYYRTRVYSLKSRSWRTIDDFPGGVCLGDHGAFLDGALYWRSPDGVVALDLQGDREVHRLVAPPPPSPNNNNKEMCWESLDALDGCLIWSCFFKGNVRGVEAWVMMEDYSWTEELYSIETPDRREMRMVGYLKREGKVFFRHWGNRDGDGLRWLDLKNMSWKDIRISDVFCCSIINPTFSLSFTQISPMSLVRLDNHHDINTSGVKRMRESEKAYTPPKRPKTIARKACGGLWRLV